MTSIVKNIVDRVLFVSLPEMIFTHEALNIVRKYFKHVQVLSYHVSNGKKEEEKKRKEIAYKIMDESTYEYLISFWNPLFLRTCDFEKASKGAVNFHPSPPEHPGLGGWVYVRLWPEKRSFHGTTCHEIDKKLDHGTIYKASRFEVDHLSDDKMVRKSADSSLFELEEVCRVIQSGVPTKNIPTMWKTKKESWGSKYYSHNDEMEWIKNLKDDHPVKALNMTNGKILFDLYGTKDDLI